MESTKDILAKLEEDLELRGFSSGTKQMYRSKINSYLRFIKRPLQETYEADVRDYLKHLRRSAHLENCTINCYLAAIRFLYIVVLGYPLDRLQVPNMKLPKRLPVILSRDEVASIIDAAENTKHKVMIMLAYSAGLRVSEIISLKVEDIDSKSMRIYVREGKGAKDRYTLLSKVCLEALRRYWVGYRPEHPDGWLFPGVCSTGHIKSSAVAGAFGKALSASKVTKRASMHTMRNPI